jgi:hypothetical protein
VAAAAAAAAAATAADSLRRARSRREPKICETVLDHIGNTPMVRLNKVTAGLECEVGMCARSCGGRVGCVAGD